MKKSTDSINSIKQSIYYLNMKELVSFCKYVGVDIDIYVQKKDNMDNIILVKTGETDRKEIIVDKILKFISEKKVSKTVIPLAMISNKKLPNKLSKYDFVYYDQFKNGNKKILKLMKSLTDDKFKFGSVSVILLKDSWTKRKRPLTYQQFAKLWIIQYKKDNNVIRPEWKYMTEISKGMDRDQWKTVRNRVAKEVLNNLIKMAK